MKFSNATPNKEKRSHIIRLVISCTLIAVLLISTSIGLTYARYKGVSRESLNFSDLNFAHSDNVVIQYVDPDAPSTLLNYKDGAVKVSIPKAISDADSSVIAYALRVKEYSAPAYDIQSGSYKTSATISVFGLMYPTGSKLLTSVVTSADQNYLIMTLKGETSVSSATSNCPDDWGLSVNSETGNLNFSSVTELGSYDSDVNIDISFNKPNWSDNAKTEWYDPENPQTEYNLNRAGYLAGLAKLVNEGVDFKGVTFNLTDDINLYGTGGEGDIREWTPIGTEDHPFMGSFNGNGHSITGLVLSGGIAADYIGLFGAVEGDPESETGAPFIKNFTLVKPAVYAKSGKSIGTIVGLQTAGYEISDFTITDLEIDGDSDAYIGLVAGTADVEYNYPDSSITASILFDNIGRVLSVAPTEAPTEKPNYELPAY